MNPIILFPLSLCILSSCTLSDWQAQTPTPTVQTIAPQVTTDATVTTQVLTEAYQEELLAEAIYRDIVATYPALASVSNIIGSEEQHSTQVGRLLTARGIALPTDFGIYTDTYTTLKSMVDSSLTGAIEVGIMVETGDIDHLLAEYQKVTDADVRQVFENIGGGSFNHLRAFLRFASEYNYIPKTDTTKYLSVAETNQGGSLKFKMTELLKANDLPTSGVTGNQGGWQWHGQGRGRMNQ
jgi:hypothetical protein